MSTVQEIFTNVGYNSFPEINRLKQLTFTGESSTIVTGSPALGDTGGGFADIACSSFQFSFAPWYYNQSHFVYGAGVKRALTYNLDKKLLVIADVTSADTSATYPAYICLPRVSVIKSENNYFFTGKTSRDKYRGNQSCAAHYGTVFQAFNYIDHYTYSSNSARKSSDGKISLQNGFCMSPVCISGVVGQEPRRFNSNLYLADGDISGMFEDVGKIIQDESGISYICCGYRIWMIYD